MVNDNLRANRWGKKVLMPPRPGPLSPSPGHCTSAHGFLMFSLDPNVETTPALSIKTTTTKRLQILKLLLPGGGGHTETDCYWGTWPGIRRPEVGPKAFMTTCLTIHKVFLSLSFQIYSMRLVEQISQLGRATPVPSHLAKEAQSLSAWGGGRAGIWKKPLGIVVSTPGPWNPPVPAL